MRPAPLLLALALAGCLAPSAPPSPPGGPAGPVAADWHVRALPFGEGHNHSSPAEHANLSTPNFRVLGWDPLPTDLYQGAGAGGYFCGEAAQTAEGRRLAVVGSFSSDVAFVVSDVTDPAHPTTVGEYALPGVHVYDVAITRDGLHVAVGTNPEPPALPIPLLGAGPRGVQPMVRSCGSGWRAAGPEQQLPLAPGVVLVGVADPANPVFEDFAPTPVIGPHSVSTADVDGAQYVLASITNLQHQASYFTLFEVTATPLGPKLVELSTYQAPPPGPNVALVNGHVDGSIQKHPLDGKVYAYLADWDAGVIIVDITNPRTPIQVSQWTDYTGPGPLDSGDATGAIHDALPIEGLWDEKHYTLAGQELGGRPQNRPSGWVHILDTTDPANPQLVGQWVLPVDVQWDSFLMFSTHYIDVVNRTLFVSMYHGGVWAVDLSGNLSAPKTLGVFEPTNVPAIPAAHAADGWTPDVLQAIALPTGDLVVYDDSTGLYVVRFDPTVDVPPVGPWA
ncbi:MAG TPA: hypothetical protein VGR28_01180 [Candidatus Thermoplasmatota archaeon]|nr:hypothetical protein [Candidatus Thermoplasmatota archaeon]